MGVCAAPRFPVPAQAMNLLRSTRARRKTSGGAWGAVLAMGSVLLVSACGLRLGEYFSSADGKQLYLSACAPCHGATGSGDGPVTSALKMPPPDLTQLARKYGGQFPRAMVVETIAGEHNFAAHGTREMPVWNQRFGTGGFGAPAVASVYARRNIEALTDHIESIQRPNR